MSKSIRRNDECPCGSGKKYKKCCLGKTDNPEYCSIENAANVFKEPLINHRYFITIDKSVRESSLSRAFSGFGFPVIRS